VYFMTEAVQSMTFDLRTTISNKLNRLPVSYFDQQQYGDILNRITNDIDTISNAFQMSILQVFNAALQLLLVIIMMLLIQWQFALIMFLVIPLSGYIAKRMINRSQPYFKEQAD